MSMCLERGIVKGHEQTVICPPTPVLHELIHSIETICLAAFGETLIKVRAGAGTSGISYCPSSSFIEWFNSSLFQERQKEEFRKKRLTHERRIRFPCRHPSDGLCCGPEGAKGGIPPYIAITNLVIGGPWIPLWQFPSKSSIQVNPPFGIVRVHRWSNCWESGV